jgi:hypothetical protein
VFALCCPRFSNIIIVKRREKKRENERKKAEKAATAGAAVPSRPKEKSAEEAEKDLNPNVSREFDTTE